MNTQTDTKTVSVKELISDYPGALHQAEDHALAIHNGGCAEAYLLAAKRYEDMIAYIEDLEDIALVRERADGPFVDVIINE